MDTSINQYIYVLSFFGFLVAAETTSADTFSFTTTSPDETAPVSQEIWEQLDATRETTAQQAVDYLQHSPSLPTGIELNSIHSNVDMHGKTHTRIAVQYQGIPVANSGVIIHTNVDDSIKQSGAVPNVPALNTTPALSTDDVKTLVQQLLADAVIAPEKVEVTLQIKLLTELTLKEGVSNALTATATDYENKVVGSLLIYRAEVAAIDHTGPHRHVFEIDAQTGEVVLQYDNLDHFTLTSTTGNYSPTPVTDTKTTTTTTTFDDAGDTNLKVGNGRSQYSGLVTVDVTSIDIGIYYALGKSESTVTPKGSIDKRLIDVRSFDSEYWFDLQYDDASEYVVDDMDYVWGNGANFTEDDAADIHPTDSVSGETAAVDALYGAMVTWDMWKNVFNHTGFDGKGVDLFKLAVHTGPLPATATLPISYSAFYDKGVAYFPDPKTGEKQFLSPDIVGHELGHGFYNKTVVFNYPRYGEPGGISEANADIMGTLTEFYESVYPDDASTVIPDSGGNWTVGEQTQPVGQPVRFMYKPSKDREYKEDGKGSFDYWYPGMNDASINGHRSAGPMNRMFYFLSMGAEPEWSDPDFDFGSMHLPEGMTGIGIHKAGEIWYRAIKDYLLPPFEFKTMRQACENAAADLYGDFSPEQKAVQNAFAAVFVGDPADQTPPEISISVSGPLDNHVVHVELVDTSIEQGLITVTAKNITRGDEFKYVSNFFGTSGSINLGNIEYYTLKVEVVASDQEGNEARKIQWFDYEAPDIVAGEFGDNNGHTNDGVSCSPAGDHHLNIRNCTVKVIDTRSISHLELIKKINGQSTVIDTIYRQSWSGGINTLPYTGGDTICDTGCTTPDWPTPLSHTFEFDVDLNDTVAPGAEHYYYVKAYDYAENNSSVNGNFTLYADEWAPEIDISVDGTSGVLDLTAVAMDATGDINLKFEVDGDLACEYNDSGWYSFPMQSTCRYESSSLSNGTHTFSVVATDQFGNSTTRSTSFDVYNGSTTPSCTNTFYEVENNGAGVPNRVPSCIGFISGDYDDIDDIYIANGQPLDAFTIQLPPGSSLTLTSGSYCSYAQLEISDGNWPDFSATMDKNLTNTISNTGSYTKNINIDVIFFNRIWGSCRGKGSYKFSITID